MATAPWLQSPRPKAQGQRRDGEGQAQRLDELIALQVQGLKVGHGRDDEDTGGPGDNPGEAAHDRPEPGLQCRP
ncbi:hypothetical protein SAMN07250955_11678 [Arboricoccus pini]|uniref:Uncharacterized protein n=1 Tax=Arboricoccus pini TaxID=1963835 RepID=A0A212RXP9_9PROT|nr:hypothetical protein SAMN07250955_11678 [Arboricoccus pini]